MMNRKNIIIIGVVLLFSVLSFITYSNVFSSKPELSNNTLTDTLSGETYTTGGIYNYRETNPYGSYFIGFDSLTDAGVSDGDMTYINDVLTNFVMYSTHIYNGKVSYVKDSFSRQKNNNDDGYSYYSFKFGVNDNNINSVKIRSSFVDKKITISIINNVGKAVFNKSFNIISLSYSDK